MATNDESTGLKCPRCATAVAVETNYCPKCRGRVGSHDQIMAAAKARLADDDARWHSVLADIINGDVRVGPDPNGPGILLTTPTGTAGLASLAHLVRDLQQPAPPKPAPLFGTSEVPETVTVTVPLGLSALNPALADGRIEVVLNFLSDSELAPKVDNPSVTVRGYGVQPGKPAVKTDWRTADDDDTTGAA